MAQTVLLPTLSYGSYDPSSPDPTPLRLLAFSVAEAALQPDPNSPSFYFASRPSVEGDWVGPWSFGKAPEAQSHGPVGGGKRLWDVVERAKERREKEKPSLSKRVDAFPPSPPVSPASYKFILPSNSHLAASIAESPERIQPNAGRPRSNLLTLNRRAFPLFTRSAEPSPTDATFAGLDQTRPPPEFVPRLSASDFVKARPAPKKAGAPSPSATLKQQATSPTVPAPSRHTSRLPSLAQIQAKLQRAQGHKRGSSVGSVSAVPITLTRPPSVRNVSEDSLEILQTPTDEFPDSISQPRIVHPGMTARPPTPPSPTAGAKEGRLAPFLRERTSGRLAGARSRPLSMPPLRSLDLPGVTDGPVLKITPPSLEQKPLVSPTRLHFLSKIPSHFSTLPSKTAPFGSSPASPTESIRSVRSSSTSSPTISVPTITCTPAPARTVRNGVEQDSDAEGGDVVLFEAEDELESLDDERERRGREMREKLMLRRRSD